MIRGKLETTTTGTGNLTVSTATSFQNADADTRITSPLDVSGNEGYEYLLADANGTAWEHGFGRQATTTFVRSQVLESTNADAAISLTSGTHTVFLIGQGIKNRCASLRYTKSATLTAGSGFLNDWTGYDQSVDNAWDLPGATAPTLPVYNPQLPTYFKGFTHNLFVTQDSLTTQTGHIYINAYNYNLYIEPTIAVVMNTATALSQSAESQMIGIKPPFATFGGWGYTLANEWEYRYINTGAGSIDVDLVLQIDLYL